MEGYTDLPLENLTQAKLGRLVVITGFTASGKDTLMNRMLTQGLMDGQIMSYTTRPPRDGETNGVDYNFLSGPIFEDMIGRGEFFQYNSIQTPDGRIYYGNKKDDMYRILKGEDMIWRVSIDAAAKADKIIRSSFMPQIAEFFIGQMKRIFISVERLTVSKDRARNRSDMNNNEILSRLRGEYNDYVTYGQRFDFTVVNSDVDDAYENIYQYLTQNEQPIQRHNSNN